MLIFPCCQGNTLGSLDFLPLVIELASFFSDSLLSAWNISQCWAIKNRRTSQIRLRINNDVQYSFSLIKSIPLCLSWEVISQSARIVCANPLWLRWRYLYKFTPQANQSRSFDRSDIAPVRTQEGVIWKRLIQYNMPDSHFQVSNISSCQPLWLGSADAYSCFVVCKWPLSVSMPHSLTDTLC